MVHVVEHHIELRCRLYKIAAATLWPVHSDLIFLPVDDSFDVFYCDGMLTLNAFGFFLHFLLGAMRIRVVTPH